MKPTRVCSLATRCLALALACAVLSGCITRTVRETVYTERSIEVLVRGEKRGGEIVDQGYAHPVTISSVRLINILSLVDIRVGAERRPAIATELLDPVSRGLAEGLAMAGPGQEVVVMAVDKQRRWGVFSHKYLTSFVAYAKAHDLYLHFSRIDWEIPERRRDRLPEPNPGDEVMAFSMMPDDQVELAGTQAVRVAWRSPAFRRASRVRRTASGQLIRRTVLMEEPLLAPDVEQPPTVSDVDSPDALRALAELAEARRRGELSEEEYRTRRAKILERAAGSKDSRIDAPSGSEKDSE